MSYLKGEFSVADYIDQGLAYPNMSYDELRLVVNGIGPEWFPPVARDALNDKFEIFKDAATIHDCDYDNGTTQEDKVAADNRFLTNCRRCVRYQIPFWCVFKWWGLYGIAKLFYNVVRDYGDTAFWQDKIRIP